MTSRIKIQECTMRARSATGAEAKLNAIADAIDEFADYIELMEHQLRNIETKSPQARNGVVVAVATNENSWRREHKRPTSYPQD
jgi:hypothetical protein